MLRNSLSGGRKVDRQQQHTLLVQWTDCRFLQMVLPPPVSEAEKSGGAGRVRMQMGQELVVYLCPVFLSLSLSILFFFESPRSLLTG